MPRVEKPNLARNVPDGIPGISPRHGALRSTGGRFMFGPMTTIVAAVLAAAFITGIVVIVRASRESARGKRVCEHCQNVNPQPAHFCAHCGKPLSS